MNTIERDIKIYLIKNNLKPSDVYKTLGIGRATFYQAIRSNNLNNKTLNKIFDYLNLELELVLKERKNDNECSKIQETIPD